MRRNKMLKLAMGCFLAARRHLRRGTTPAATPHAARGDAERLRVRRRLRTQPADQVEFLSTPDAHQERGASSGAPTLVWESARARREGRVPRLHRRRRAAALRRATRRPARSRPGGSAAASSASSGRARSTSRPSTRSRATPIPCAAPTRRTRSASSSRRPGIAACAQAPHDRRRRPRARRGGERARTPEQRRRAAPSARR